MRYLSEDEGTQMRGLGYVSELYEDLEGNLYGWVEGVDELGNPGGSSQGLPQPEVPALSGLGALYEAPDGTLYHVQGLAEEEAADAKAESAEPEASAESEAPPATEPGEPVRPRPFRRWRPMPRGQHRRLHPRYRPSAKTGSPGHPVRRRRGFLQKLLPVAKLASRFIPIPGAGAAVRAGLTLASKLGKQRGVAGYGGLGALYAAPDGTLYQVQGLEEEDLNGLYADEELRGFAEEEELHGLAQDEELRGLEQDEELRGVANDEDLHGLAQEEELRGLDQGYVREDTVNGLEAYVPTQPAETRWFTAPDEPPELWKPLW